MRRIISVLSIAVLLLTSCKTMEHKVDNGNKEIPEGYKEAYLNRAKNLYSCGSYFRIVGKKRTKPDEIQRYENLSVEAINMADTLIAKADGNPQNKDTNLSKRYYKDGAIQAIEMVKEIGRDRTGTKFNEITVSCYQAVERERLAIDIGVIHDRMIKNNEEAENTPNNGN